jgi:succinoglycan biosynthesis transport protein ExoP
LEAQFDLQNYISILRRRYLYLVVPAIAIAIGVTALAYVMPPVYEASATILVESQQIPTDLAAPTVTTEAAERVRVIEQRLMTRDNLLSIANKFNLYQFESGNVSPTNIVDNMRRAVAIEQIKDLGTNNRSGVVGFTVGFEYRDANTASRVANELVSAILAQNVESRLNRASETSAFFEQQKKALEQRLLELEHRSAEFKRTNEDFLPETLPIRRDQLQQVRLLMNDIDQKIRLASVSDTVASLDASAATVAQLGFNIQAKELELQSYREQREELGPLAENGVVPKNRIRDLDRQIAVAEVNIEALRAQIANAGGVTGGDAITQLEAERAELERQAKAISDGILKTPLIQVELNAMDRDYENLQAEYRQAQTKLEDAQTGERLEQDRQAERFEVIEQAIVPDAPTSPDRPRLVAAGVAGGLAFGIGLLVLRQMLDRSVYTVVDVERALQMRPIATIPYIVTTRERNRKRWRVLLFILAIVVLMAAALVAVDIYYLPLDVVLQRIIERIQGWLAARGLIA